MTCGNCKHWSLAHALGQHGYGRCLARSNQVLQAGLTTSAQSACRIGRFEQAEPKVIAVRQAGTGPLL